jgi:ABC-type antimicrobial peptide transport system permease subunit
VSRRGAQVLWPDATPVEVLGRIVRVPNEPDRTVVGVVADQRGTALTGPVAGLFVPYGQASPELGPKAATMDIVVRLRPGATMGVDALRRQLRGEFPQSTVRGQAGDDLLAPSLRQPKFQAMLFGAFAVTALVLAAVGLYAIASFDVSLRRYEMGVRMALGATAADVRREVVTASVAPIAIGVALGLVGSWWASELMASLVVDVRTHDPFTSAIAAAILLATAFAAAWEPARRAARADPAVVLRAQ